MINRPEDEARRFRDRPCPCGGEWHAGQRYYLSDRGHEVEYLRRVRCAGCGAVEHFGFIAVMDPCLARQNMLRMESRPRESVFDFVHHLLRIWFEKDPETAMFLLSDPDMGRRRIAKLWSDARQHAVTFGGTACRAKEVPFRLLRIANRPAAVLTLPEPVATFEAYFMALVSPPPGLLRGRCYAFERTDFRFKSDPDWESGDLVANDTPRAALRAWDEEKDCRLVTTALRPRLPDFLAAVERDLEAVGQGLPPGFVTQGSLAAAAVAPSPDEPRPEPCVFAFHRLPGALFHQGDAWRTAVAQDEVLPFVARLWSDVLADCARRGQASGLRTRDVWLHRYRTEAVDHIVVELPPPRAAPEPHFVALPLDPSAGPVVALEQTEGRTKQCLLTRLTADGRHDVVTEFEYMTLWQFLASLPLVARGEAPEGVVRVDQARHRARYAAIAALAAEPGDGTRE